MKGRVISALFIVGALLIGYFAFDGAAFPFILIVSMLLAALEIDVVLSGQPWRVNPSVCRPHGAFAYQMVILTLAIFVCFIVKREELALVIGTSMAADVGAFTIGSLCGKHKVKFLQKISSNKSYEGFVGAIIVGGAAAALLAYLLGLEFTPVMIAYILMGGLTASIGDLLGSACKRQLDIKDSGEILAQSAWFAPLEAPLSGHGGYLDRYDSISLGLTLYGLLSYIAML